MRPPSAAPRRAAVFTALLSVALPACDGRGGGDFRLRDSAGVRVAESLAPAWEPGAGWRVSPEPALDLAAAGPGVRHELLQVVSALRLGDGRVVVADGGAREVRYYGADGRFLLARGGVSGGAAELLGELSSVSRLPGDSLLAFDAEAGRLIVLDPAGDLAGETVLAWDGSLPLDRASSLGDGSVIVSTAWRASVALEGEPGLVRNPVLFLRFHRDGALLDTVAAVPGSAVATVSLGPVRTFLPAPLGPVTVHAVHGDRLYIGTGDTFEVRVHDAEGALRGLLRVPVADLSVSPEELEAVRAERAALGGGNPMAEQLLAQAEAQIPWPTRRPAYGALLVGPAGDLWIGEYPWRGPGGFPPRQPRLWTVFDAGGRMLGSVEIPEGLELLDVGEDYLLTLYRSPTGRQNVLMYGLSR